VKRTVKIEVDIPYGWGEEDFEYLVEKLGYVLARDLPNSGFKIQELSE
jgi:hypothetical protein